MDLKVGEFINVLVDEFDSWEIDTRSIARPDGSMILDPVTGESLTGQINQTRDPLTSPGTMTISGEIIRLFDNDEFLLQTDNGPIRVDGDLPDSQSLNLRPGERVNVVGEFDDGEFDAFAITRPNGSPILGND